MLVEVLDRVMGAGKTNAILQWLQPEMNFIFVTPLLSEAEERIGSVRPDLAVKCPLATNVKVGEEWVCSKTEDMLHLLQARENIATTHALLRGCDERHWKLIQQFGYTIVLDEEINLIEAYDGVPTADMMWLFDNGHLSVSGEAGQLVFEDTSVIEDFKYADVKEMCRKKMLYAAKRSNKFIVSCLPIDVLLCSKRVIILTYMFEGSILEQFLTLHGVQWKPFDEVSVPHIKPSEYAHLLTQVNDRYYKPYEKLKLSQSGWARMTPEDVKQVEKTLNNIFSGLHADVCAFAVPKYYVQRTGRMKNRLVKPRGKIHQEKQQTWLYPKCRATNEYANKTTLVYALDIYPNAAVQAYLKDMGCEVDESKYALSQLVQWLWRGCIRNGEPMTVAVLAPRMRKLFEKWLADGYVNVQNSPVELESDIDVSYAHEQGVVASENLNAAEDKWDGFEEDTSVAQEPNTFPAEFDLGIGDYEMPKLDWEGFN